MSEVIYVKKTSKIKVYSEALVNEWIFFGNIITKDLSCAGNIYYSETQGVYFFRPSPLISLGVETLDSISAKLYELNSFDQGE